MSVELRLNPNLDLTPYAEIYRQRGVVQIPEIFEPATAEAVRDMLMGSLTWRLLMTDDDNRPIHFSKQEWENFGEERRTDILKGVEKRALNNEGLFYYTYPMIEAYLQGWDKGHQIHQMTEFINGPDFLGLGRVILGQPGLTKAEAHACQYRSGHYLTRHVDDSDESDRRAAYVLGFTKGWMPDWGGLLLFLKDNQDVDFGYLPQFNNLTVFEIKQLHTVTQLASFAHEPRLTITGWLRDDAPVGGR